MIVTTLRATADYSDLGLLHLICSTPDMPKLYVRNTDRGALDRMIDAHEGELWIALPHDDESQEEYYRALKTAMLLNDWADELPDARICERYWWDPAMCTGWWKV